VDRDARSHETGGHAGFVSRAMAFVVDAFIIAVVFTLAIWLLDGLELAFGRSLANHARIAPFVAASAPVGFGAYFVFFWTMWGQTPGKWLLGLRVVCVDGGPLTFRRALLRFAAYVFSALPAYLGFFWILIDPERCAWHDRLAGTRVVYVADQSAALWRRSPDPRSRKLRAGT
jgi:uncharacterized RDD family membrane protein YckC